MKQRFCAYCRTFRADEGFKTILHTKSNTRRCMCHHCQELRKLPRPVLQEMADRDRQDKKKSPPGKEQT